MSQQKMMNIAERVWIIVVLTQLALLTLAEFLSVQSLPNNMSLLLYFLQTATFLGMGLCLCFLLYMTALDLIKGNK